MDCIQLRKMALNVGSTRLSCNSDKTKVTIQLHHMTTTRFLARSNKLPAIRHRKSTFKFPSACFYKAVWSFTSWTGFCTIYPIPN